MAAVQAFITRYGWNMETNSALSLNGFVEERTEQIRGLPWEAIRDREFPAVTHRGVLYVKLGGGHHSVHGVAYNPNTNAFAPTIAGFKPIGQHWYVWAQLEDPIPLERQYEGGSRLFAYTAKIIKGNVYLSLNSVPEQMIGPFVKRSNTEYTHSAEQYGVDYLKRSPTGNWLFSSTWLKMRSEPVDGKALEK